MIALSTILAQAGSDPVTLTPAGIAIMTASILLVAGALHVLFLANPA